MVMRNEFGAAFLELIISTVILLVALLHMRRLQMSYAGINRRTYIELQQLRSEKEEIFQRLRTGECTNERTSYGLAAIKCTNNSSTYVFLAQTTP